ncbi:MAG: undecaprenyl-diphosphate phosphatase [Alphaproteobacteria bacterium]|nr:undecaprenyl-diphosphate phosphatase [Alphaproteobacteria bacterium]
MTLQLLLDTILLGLVEGITEFLPVSSTGHLILVDDLLGFSGPPGKVFEIVIQLGAILAVCVLYFRKLLGVLVGLPSDPQARRFTLNLLWAFLPAAVVGLLAHGFIKSVLFSPWVVSVSLIVGGILILVIERVRPQPVYRDVDDLPAIVALKIGCAQVVSMIPGVSRAGATIMGAMMFRVDRATAAEFSFFLAIPTMVAATAYDVYKNRAALTLDDAQVIAIGFVVAFVSALIVVRWLIGFISRHGFGPFAWYRIMVGALMLGILISRS